MPAWQLLSTIVRIPNAEGRLAANTAVLGEGRSSKNERAASDTTFRTDAVLVVKQPSFSQDPLQTSADLTRLKANL
jgi:hypothetical protein